MKRSIYVLSAIALMLCVCADATAGGRAKIGKPLPAWKEGELDIHFINTGLGECTWQIFPDGTTFLVDASGDILNNNEEKYKALPARPNSGISPGKVICDYINHFSPAVSAGHINYFMLTHRHGDHMGFVSSSLPQPPMHGSGLFRLFSLPEIGSTLIMDNILDRDPSFTYPTPLSKDRKVIKNYKAFLDWTVATNGTKVVQWNAGSHSQVVPVYGKKYDVKVQAYSGNGCFWTGEGEDVYRTMPTAEELSSMPKGASPSENHLSCSYILTYGDFDFFCGGDLEYNDRKKFPYLDAEAPIARVAHKVEVMKANHHGESATHDTTFISVLRPDVWLVGTWRDRHPQAKTLDRVMRANPDCEIFCTNMPPKNINGLGAERLDKIVSKYGHVVVRVAKGGKSYMIYTLVDSDQLYNVKSIHGPYKCTK